MAELGCLASMPIFSSTMPLACDALADGRVGLLGLDADLLEHDALGVRRAAEGLGVLRDVVRLGVLLVRPLLEPPVVLELAPGAQAVRLALAHGPRGAVSGKLRLSPKALGAR